MRLEACLHWAAAARGQIRYSAFTRPSPGYNTIRFGVAREWVEELINPCALELRKGRRRSVLTIRIGTFLLGYLAGQPFGRN